MVLISYFLVINKLLINTGSWFIVINFSNTQRAGGQTGRGLTNIRLLRPGYSMI
jgi:hypothetical protein